MSAHATARAPGVLPAAGPNFGRRVRTGCTSGDVVRHQAAPPALVALALAEALPVRVDDRDRGPLGGGREADLDTRGVLAVLAQVPPVGEAARRVPLEHLAPVVLLAGRRALEDAAAGARLEGDGETGVGRDGVALWPPQRRALRPHRERVLRRARHRERELERRLSHQRPPKGCLRLL